MVAQWLLAYLTLLRAGVGAHVTWDDCLKCPLTAADLQQPKLVLQVKRQCQFTYTIVQRWRWRWRRATVRSRELPLGVTVRTAAFIRCHQPKPFESLLFRLIIGLVDWPLVWRL
jgi:hypothetical protein